MFVPHDEDWREHVGKCVTVDDQDITNAIVRYFGDVPFACDGSEDCVVVAFDHDDFVRFGVQVVEQAEDFSPFLGVDRAEFVFDVSVEDDGIDWPCLGKDVVESSDRVFVLRSWHEHAFFREVVFVSEVEVCDDEGLVLLEIEGEVDGVNARVEFHMDSGYARLF